MIKDRLNELKSRRKSGADVSPDVAPSKEEEEIFSNMERFAELNEWIRTIRDNIEEMQAAVSTPAFHYNDKVMRSKVENRMEQSIALCRRIHASIKQLQEDLETEDARGSILFRVKHTQLMVIRDAYLKAYGEHEEFVNYYEDRITKIMKMEAIAMNSNLTDDEATQLLMNKQMSPFVGNILEETEKARQMLRDVMARHTQLVELENSLVEIRDLFVRISTLVMEQGSLVQVIEYHAQQASMNTDHGTQQLEKARENKIKALKKKSCLYIWVIVILVLVLVIIIF
ncbi:syntaxin-4-like [Toxorhynchites rutilus septentrionalis]|uniref:syntaxin-4-like n=1 Tax=Toxorhynchites rutilus septentrionalis TaxID=329112 RepID=UPI00247B2AD0|nr:syntaxin-4-like [Toxorhynchites rutilus septentrionalis]